MFFNGFAKEDEEKAMVAVLVGFCAPGALFLADEKPVAVKKG